MVNHERLILDASKAWAPDVSPDAPRRVSTAASFQEPVENRFRLVSSLIEAGNAGKNGVVST
jgi:hypothetical protein